LSDIKQQILYQADNIQESHCTYKSKIEWRSRNNFDVKIRSTIRRVCTCSHRYQYTMRVSRVILSIWLYNFLSHYSINGTISCKKFIGSYMRVLIFSKMYVDTFLILRIIQRDMIINVQRSLGKCPLFFSDLFILEFCR
jgi:hypothetical protein